MIKTEIFYKYKNVKGYDLTTRVHLLKGKQNVITKKYFVEWNINDSCGKNIQEIAKEEYEALLEEIDQ